MERSAKVICLFLGLSLLIGQSDSQPNIISKEFVPAGRIEALLDGIESKNLFLVQLDLKNDSLFNLANDILPNMELFSGPASYHRIMESH
ncbi:uncharacterized protein METZ01_LOCUS433948, partial [marine metagenome]